VRAEVAGAVEEAPAPAAAPAPADLARSREAAMTLIQMLSDLDPCASDFVESNLAALRGLFEPDAWTEFEARVRDYAFADAQTRLEQVLGGHPVA
jgi:hypothetical protein